MFGYINVNKEELSKEEFLTYQAYYCGLCRRLRANYGSRAQMLLNYDMTFLVVLLSGLYEPKENEEKFVCSIHPTRKRSSVVSEISDYAAAMNVALAYHNLVDDWKDDKKYTRKAIASLIEKDYQKVAKEYPKQVDSIENYIAHLGKLEEQREANIDVVAGITGEMLGDLLAYKEDEWEKELKTLGFYLGKFIYLMDAYEDLDKDEKRGSYNPLLALKKEQKENFEDVCKLMISSMLSEGAMSFERLPILMHANILRNILYSGVWSKYEYIQLKKKKK